MAQDIIADALNQIKNASRANKKEIIIKRFSKLLIEILKIMKENKYIKSYKINVKNRTIDLILGEINECKAIKPRFYVKKDGIEKYRRRYLPSRNIGIIIISTNYGLITYQEALEKNIGGSLIAYLY